MHTLCCCVLLQGSGVYPGPLTELDFWTERAGNLNSIHGQLSGEKIQKVVKVLELAQSTYHPAFERLFQVRGFVSRCRLEQGLQTDTAFVLVHPAWLCHPIKLSVPSLPWGALLLHAALTLQDVDAARQEAIDNVKFLKPLRRFLEKLNAMDDFVALADQFKPLLHVMLLIWKHSSSYNSSARFATLLREVCNDLIMQVGCACGWGG